MNRIKLGLAALVLSFMSMGILAITENSSASSLQRGETAVPTVSPTVSPTMMPSPMNPSDPTPTPSPSPTPANPSDPQPSPMPSVSPTPK